MDPEYLQFEETCVKATPEEQKKLDDYVDKIKALGKQANLPNF